MIKYRLILLILGILLVVESVFIGIAAGVSCFYAEDDLTALLFSASLALIVGLFLFVCNRKVDKKVERREAYIIVCFSWILLSLFGALPFWLSRHIPSYTDAFFETISGFTTTGATILNNIETLPHGLLLWRSLTQWIGGMGIIVLSIALVSIIKLGGMQLFNAEVPGISTDKLHPRIKQTAKRLWLLYLSLTIVQTTLLYLGDMPLFDAVCHSLTTMSSGGYSTKQDSIAYYNSPYIQYVIIFFMILAGTNFSLIYHAFSGKFKKIIRNTEIKFYLLIIVIITLIIATGLRLGMGIHVEEALRTALFQVVSILTTTGFITSDYMQWTPVGLWGLICLLMLIGASAGSTSGGVKVVRVHIMIRNCLNEFKRLIHPNVVLPVKYNKVALPQATVNNVTSFIYLYFLILVVSTIVMMFTGLDLETAFGSTATSLGNIGPGLGATGPIYSFANISCFGKWYLGFLMLVGRLEIFTVLILFTKSFWKK